MFQLLPLPVEETTAHPVPTPPASPPNTPPTTPKEGAKAPGPLAL